MVLNYKTINEKGIIDGEIYPSEPTNIKNKRNLSKIFISVSLGIILISSCLLNFTLFLMTVRINNDNRNSEIKDETILKLQEQINVLRHDVDLLKHRYVDNDFFQDIKNFESEVRKHVLLFLNNIIMEGIFLYLELL